MLDNSPPAAIIWTILLCMHDNLLAVPAEIKKEHGLLGSLQRPDLRRKSMRRRGRSRAGPARPPRRHRGCTDHLRPTQHGARQWCLHVNPDAGCSLHCELGWQVRSFMHAGTGMAHAGIQAA